MSINITPRKWFTYEEAAAYLGMSVRQVERAKSSGKLGATKLGGLHVRFSQAQLDAYVEACTIAPAANATK
ncbi:excisionase family DNA-binding protein [Leifsonia sp. NPDC102414]|uniref:excisionase family DNA-binding protein n=1 Tax=Leifsonia sp. NPDC102414 TaxID=3364124 RepID=UPI00381A26D6